jgi:hypothetical protein
MDGTMVEDFYSDTWWWTGVAALVPQVRVTPSDRSRIRGINVHFRRISFLRRGVSSVVGTTRLSRSKSLPSLCISPV